MRFVRLIPFVLLAAGCGDNNTGINPRRDSGPGQDSNEDAPPDAPPGGAARVWVVGDFITDNRRTAGSFLTDATLPFNPTTPTPVVIPGGPTGTAELFDSGTPEEAATPNVFHTNGSKIAYVANETDATRYDLYVADADGANPVLVITGSLTQQFTSVALSPDGTKVAYLQDGLLLANNLFDLYVAPTTAGATGVKVNPDRGAVPMPDQDVFTTFTWSADSKYLSFSADLTESQFDEVYVTDTTTTPTPTTVAILPRADIMATTGSRGVRGAIVFDAQNNVYFRARVEEASPNFTLFKAAPDNAASRTPITLPMRGDNSIPDVGAFGVTPDGTKIVYSADAPTAMAYDLYVATTATPDTNMKLTNLTGPGGASLFAPLSFSPDSTKVAVAADLQADNVFEPTVVHLDGSATRRLVAVTCTGCDANLVQFAPDNTTVWAMGDFLVDNNTQIYKLDSTMMDQTPTLAVDVPAGGDMVNLYVTPN